MSLSIVNEERVKRFRSLPPGQSRRLYIVGASGAGKSTLWRAMHALSHPKVAFPARFISRPGRPDDDHLENQHLGVDRFPIDFQNDLLHFYWPKFLPSGTELYGFSHCDASAIVYGCNNEFLLNAPSLVSRSELLLDGLALVITSSSEVRAKRLASRYASHAIPASELNYRLAGDVNDQRVRAACDLVLANDSDDICTCASEILRLLFAFQETQP